jgi:hypothetical protein
VMENKDWACWMISLKVGSLFVRLDK